jgi:hypothetical protein
MLSRRTLLAGGVLAGTVSGASADTAGAAGAAQGSGSSREADERMVKVLEEIRDQMRLDSGGGFPDTIRGLQRDFLKSRGKFPDFIEVGVDVWEAVMNWHVRTRQVPQVQRMADGRYTVAVFLTNVVLRHDVSNNYIGMPYDAK